jgi:hypothetical protein
VDRVNPVALNPKPRPGNPAYGARLASLELCGALQPGECCAHSSFLYRHFRWVEPTITNSLSCTQASSSRHTCMMASNRVTTVLALWLLLVACSCWLQQVAADNDAQAAQGEHAAAADAVLMATSGGGPCRSKRQIVSVTLNTDAPHLGDQTVGSVSSYIDTDYWMPPGGTIRFTAEVLAALDTTCAIDGVSVKFEGLKKSSWNCGRCAQRTVNTLENGLQITLVHRTEAGACTVVQARTRPRTQLTAGHTWLSHCMAAPAAEWLLSRSLCSKVPMTLSTAALPASTA